VPDHVGVGEIMTITSKSPPLTAFTTTSVMPCAFISGFKS